MSYFDILNEEKQEGQGEYLISINANHSVYEGHFPGNPIMPGVVQLQIITDLLSHYLGKEVSLKNARSLKFLNVINPNEVKKLNVLLKTTDTEKGTRVAAIGSFEGRKYFKLNGTFGS